MECHFDYFALRNRNLFANWIEVYPDQEFGEGFKLEIGNISLKGKKGKRRNDNISLKLATAIAAQVDR